MRAIDLRQALDLAETIAAELAAAAIDPETDLDLRDRKSLVVLSLAVEAASAQTAGFVARTPEAEAVLLQAIMASVLP